jgi:anti-sigma B factor antagonist
MRGLDISKARLSDADWAVLAVAGEIDLATVPELERAIKAILDDGSSSNLMLDLSDTSFMDSTGLRVLIMTSREFNDGGRDLAILVKPGPISRLLDVSGMHELLRVIGDPAELDS